MQSGSENFLRRHLRNPLGALRRWSGSAAGQPQALQAAAATGDVPPTAIEATAPPTSIITIIEPSVPAAPEALLDAQAMAQAIEETIPAILWRDSQDPAAPAVPADLPLVAQAGLTGDLDLDLPTVLPPLGNPEPKPARPTLATHEQVDHLLEGALQAAQAGSHLGAIVRLGLARLDEVSDAWGERAVTHVLKALHQRLALLLADVAPQATLCATGDGYWLVLPHMERTSVVEALVRQLLEALARPLRLQQHSLALHGSAGLAVFPHDGTRARALRRGAEVAWHQARQRGRGAYQFYAREMADRAKRRLTMEARLRHAITHEEITLAYQPRAEVKTGALCGAEVQALWTPLNEPTWSASELLMLAEEAGLGEALAHYSVGAACRQLRAWLDAGLDVPQLSLPILPGALQRAGFIEAVAEQVRAQRLEPQRLTLLLSPVAPLAASPATLGGLDLQGAAPRLRRCREAGFRVAIDGAATSTCSLVTLRQLPLSELRLDCDVLAALDDADGGLAAAIIALGHRLGLRVGASGVHDDDQLDRLRRLGCDEFQGGLLADALAADTWAGVMAGAQIVRR